MHRPGIDCNDTCGCDGTVGEEEIQQCGLYQHPPKECRIPSCPFCKGKKPMSIDWTKPVETVFGVLVRVLCTNASGKNPVVFLMEDDCSDDGLECVGRCDIAGRGHHPWNDYQLRNRKIKKEGWINLYRGSLINVEIPSSIVFLSREQAERRKNDATNYITTIKIEWEE